MPDYSKGKIYKIVNSFNDEFYVGSTTQTFSKRWSAHKAMTKRETTNKLWSYMKTHGVEKFHMELIEDFPCERVEQLTEREGQLIKELKPTLNCYVSGRDMTQWRKDNKEKLSEANRIYYQKHKERLKEKRKFKTSNLEPVS